jgi:hypothetical protein
MARYEQHDGMSNRGLERLPYECMASWFSPTLSMFLICHCNVGRW